MSSEEFGLKSGIAALQPDALPSPLLNSSSVFKWDTFQEGHLTISLYFSRYFDWLLQDEKSTRKLVATNRKQGDPSGLLPTESPHILINLYSISWKRRCFL
jgi:hypothetical protein